MIKLKKLAVMQKYQHLFILFYQKHMQNVGSYFAYIFLIIQLLCWLFRSLHIIQFFDCTRNTIYTVINMKRNVIDFQNQLLAQECSKQIAINETKKITELRLRNNKLTAKYVLPISKMNWKKLQLLYLTLNDSGNIGCKYISQMSLPCLTKLGLGENNIENAGIVHLSKGLWPTLQQIYLFDNKIGVGIIGMIMRANWPRLKQLLLQSNKFGHSQVFHLFLYPLSSLKFLRISPNNMERHQYVFKFQNNQILKIHFRNKFDGVVIKIDE